MDTAEFRAWLDLADLFFDNFAFLILAYLFALKGLNFRRLTLLGRMLSAVALSMALVYVLAFIWPWWTPEWFQWVRRAARLMLIIYLVKAVLAMSWTYGGWKAMHLRAWRNLCEMVKLRHIPIEYDRADRWGS